MSFVPTIRSIRSHMVVGAMIAGALLVSVTGSSLAAQGGNNPGGGGAKPVADLALTGGASAVAVPIFRDFRYTLAARNNGPDTASSVSITSTMPTGLTVTSATFTVAGCAAGAATCATPPTTGTCATGATLNCNLGRVAAGLTASVTTKISATSAGTKALSFVIAGNGTDRVAGNDALTATVRVDSCSIRGTAGPDTLRGTSGRDALCGLGGNDLLIGNGSNDVLVGGLGADVLRGGYGNDLLRGDAGVDTQLGGPGADILRGGIGSDLLRGENGDDSIFAGAGNDRLIGGAGSDRLVGSTGSDTFYARDAVRDTISGGLGIDRARLDRGIDVASGVERMF